MLVLYRCLRVLRSEFAARAGAPIRLTIEETVARAVAQAGDLIREPQERRHGASEFERAKALLPSNPSITAGSQSTWARRSGRTMGLTLSQEFEIAGQRGKRTGAAARRSNGQSLIWRTRDAPSKLRSNRPRSALSSVATASVSRNKSDSARSLVAGERGEVRPLISTASIGTSC